MYTYIYIYIYACTYASFASALRFSHAPMHTDTRPLLVPLPLARPCSLRLRSLQHRRSLQHAPPSRLYTREPRGGLGRWFKSGDACRNGKLRLGRRRCWRYVMGRHREIVHTHANQGGPQTSARLQHSCFRRVLRVYFVCARRRRATNLVAAATLMWLSETACVFCR